MEIIRSIQEIKPKIESSELGEALNNLLVVTIALDFFDLNQQLVLTKSRYNENKKNNRIGVLSKADYDLETNKIRKNILEIYTEIENMEDVNRKLRWEMKKIIMAQQMYSEGIIIEYAKITKGVIGKIEFPPNDFKDFGDFLNAVYLEMYEFVPPFTYGEKWLLVDGSNEPIDYASNINKEAVADTRKLTEVFPFFRQRLFVQPIEAVK